MNRPTTKEVEFVMKKRGFFRSNNDVSSAVHEVTETLSEKGQEVLHEAQKVVGRTGTKARWAAQDLSDLVGTRARRVARAVQRNSVTAVLAAAGVGVLVAGAVFLSKRKR
jgi:ElaB/YqjD/DUF883 family membrane-anchored ribosome-binding protein